MRDYFRFWQSALAVGWRVAWRLVGSSPLALARTLVFALAAAGVVWFLAPALGAFGIRADDGVAARAAASAMAAFAIVVLVVILTTAGATLAYSPYALWRDIRVLLPSETGVKGGFNLVPDTPLLDALHFAATGSWAGASPEAYGEINSLMKAIDDFIQIAASGYVRVWHRSFPDGVWEILEGSAWVSHKLDFLDVMRDRTDLRRRRDNTVVESNHGLRVCRAQWDANWAL